MEGRRVLQPAINPTSHILILIDFHSLSALPVDSFGAFTLNQPTQRNTLNNPPIPVALACASPTLAPTAAASPKKFLTWDNAPPSAPVEFSESSPDQRSFQLYMMMERWTTHDLLAKYLERRGQTCRLVVWPDRPGLDRYSVISRAP